MPTPDSPETARHGRKRGAGRKILLVDNLAGKPLGASDLPLGTFAAVNLDSGGAITGKVF